MALSVLLVEDDQFISKSIELLLSATPGFTLYGAHETSESALTALSRMKVLPDLALLDIHLPGMSGIELLQRLQFLYPTIKCVINTTDDRDDLVMKAIQHGALGYIVKKSPPTTITETLSIIAEGGSVMSFHVAGKMLKFLQDGVVAHAEKTEKPDPTREALHTLSPRLKEILLPLAQGKSYDAIAEDLHISVNTVRYHIKEIYSLLAISSRYEASHILYAEAPHLFENR